MELAHGGARGSGGRGGRRDEGRRSERGGGGYGGGFGGGVTRRSDFRVVITNLPKSASWQDLKDHMRKGGEVTFAQVRTSSSQSYLSRILSFELDEGHPKAGLGLLDASPYGKNGTRLLGLQRALVVDWL